MGKDEVKRQTLATEAILKDRQTKDFFSQMTKIDIPISTMADMRRAVKSFSGMVANGEADPIYMNPDYVPPAEPEGKTYRKNQKSAHRLN